MNGIICFFYKLITPNEWVDLVAAQLVMGWWFPDTPGWIWSALFLCVIFLLNYISVRGFG
ncbi:hypothetical protein ONJ16_26915, partial [Salmonella enterica subsp. enterica serovar Montevideo]|nr:hypothetical protein [Salmonella enterica subsp. enterica serovar Montevideo]